MKKLLSVLGAGLLALLVLAGCGPTNATGGDPNHKPTNPPGTTGGDPKPAADASLSPEDFVAGLPDNARPKDAGDTIRLDRANDWLKANAPGKHIAWDYAVVDVSLSRIGDTHDYTVTLWHAYADDKHKANKHTLHGVECDVTVCNSDSTQTTSYFKVGPIDDETADRMSSMKNKVVKVQATVDSASLGGETLTGETLNIYGRNFIINDVRTGLWRDIDRLKADGAAVRKEALWAVAEEGRGGDEKAALSALAGVATGDDKDLRREVALATLDLDPSNEAALASVPAEASVDGKYAKLLRVLYVPKDNDTYGDVKDNGHSGAYADYEGYKDIPEGYWVYVSPHWFIWKDQKKDN